MSFDLGDPVPLAVETFDSDGNPANPGTVTLTITLPDGTAVTPAFSNPSPGLYELDYPTVQVGHHQVRWLGTGINSSAYADSFDVLSATPGYIVSLARAKKKLKIPLTEHDHDDDLRDYIEAATEIVEDHVQRTVARRSFADVFDIAGWARTLTLKHSPVMSVTSVKTVDGVTTWNVGDLHVDPNTGVVTVKSGPFLTGHIESIYVAGMAVVKAKYRRAGLIIVEHLWQTERAQSVAGPYPGAYEDSAEGMRFRGGAGFAIPNRALELLGKPPTMAR